MPVADLAAWVQRADRLAAVFAATAALHDRERSFPHEHVAAARADRWPALAVPAAHGGAGASLHDVCLLQERLGRGDTSSALGLGMHHMVMGAAGPEHTGWPEQVHAAFCAQVVGDGALINSLASEPEQGSPARGGLPATTAERREGGWALEGRKTWSTWLPALTHALVAARLDEPGMPPRAGTFLVDLSLPGVRRDPSFDAVGLRATASGTLWLEGVRLPDAALLFARDPATPDPRAPSLGPWFQLTSAAAYTGCAHAARDEVTRFCRDRRPNALAEPISSLPTVRLRLGRIDGAVPPPAPGTRRPRRSGPRCSRRSAPSRSRPPSSPGRRWRTRCAWPGGPACFPSSPWSGTGATSVAASSTRRWRTCTGSRWGRRSPPARAATGGP
jgi:alkylation response protein AidB-like acyl-CoA dehydrogenase